MVELPFPELQTVGYAKVLSFGDCPPIEEGEGEVVIGRFVTRQASNLMKVTLEDGTSFTGTTNHPVWSVDASDWRRIDKLSAGEKLQTLSGVVAIASIEGIRSAADVFNVEVDGAHVYRLLNDGILVHNADYTPQSLTRNTRRMISLMDDPPGPDFDAHHLLPIGLANMDGLRDLFQKAARNGWDINGRRNGMWIDNITRHVNNHPRYTTYLETRLRSFLEGMGGVANVDGPAARAYLESVSDSMRNYLKKNTDGDINKLFEYFNN